MKKTFLLPLIALGVLAGCQQKIDAVLYTQDIRSVATEGQALKIPATVRMEMTTAKDCNKKREKLTRVISDFFLSLDRVQCVKEGNDDYYQATFELPLLPARDGQISDAYEGGMAVQAAKGEQRIHLLLTMHPERLEQLDADLRNAFTGSSGIDPEDLSIAITLNNDSRTPQKIAVEGAFVDGRAVIARFPETVTLERRDEVTIRLSDVAIHSLTGHGNRQFAYIAGLLEN